MPKIRTIKPEFWTDGDVIDMTPFARLMFIGSWNFTLCDRGHLADDPRRLKMQILPADDVNAVELLNEIMAHGRIDRIETPDGRTFLHIRRFTDHQRIESRWASRCPACKSLGLDETLSEPRATSPNLAEPRASSRELAGTRATSRKEGKGMEGNGSSSRKTDRPKAGWTPGQSQTAYAAANNIDMAAEVEKFLDHHIAKGSKFVDWDRALTTWLKNAVKWGRAELLPAAPAGAKRYVKPYEGDMNDLDAYRAHYAAGGAA